MECKMCLICYFHAIIVFNFKNNQACANFNVNLYLRLACLQVGNRLLR